MSAGSGSCDGTPPRRVAVVGGGPAGACAAAELATRGIDTSLFHVDPAHGEKPCGGGVTWKAGRDLRSYRELGLRGNPVDAVKVISPRGREVRLESAGDPFFEVHPRGVLDEALRTRAERLGARRVAEKVESVGLTAKGVEVRTASGTHAFDAVVGADGAFSKTRDGLGIPRAFVACPAVDELAEGIDAREGATIAFFPDLTGYLWVFPRVDLTSVGIVARPGEIGGAAMRDRVREFLRRRHPRARIVRSTGWVIPAPEFDFGAPPRLAGERFALVGDAAGLVDPLTGEGIYYAMASGELAGRLVAEGRAADYGRQVLDLLGPELAAAGRHVRRYFRPAFLDALHFFARHHAGTRQVIGDLLSGRQGYRNLGRGAGGLQRLLGSILRRF